MNISPGLIITYIIGFLVLYIICWIFIKPIKWIMRLLLSCALGCVAMVVINKVCAPMGTIFSLNPLTAMISGVLGVPGMVIIFILQGVL